MYPSKPIDCTRFGHLYPFRSHYLAINGLNYHYLDEGIGEPILMLHGNPTWSFYYRRLVQALSHSYRTIVPDHMGCGLSDKPHPRTYGYRLQDRITDLATLLEHLELSAPITLILHDWGGMIGIGYAVRHPERIGRIIALNTAAFLPPQGKTIPWRLKLIRNLKFFAVPAVLGLNLFARSALIMAVCKPLHPEVRAGLLAPYNSWHNRIATLKFVQDIPLGPADASYPLVREADRGIDRFRTRPMLVCWGERDFVFDADYLAAWQQRFPDAEVHRFPDAGHYVLEDVPEKIVPLILDFLQRHPV
jgi:pimeloyl-ACP methyl ester carboxylesterase